MKTWILAAACCFTVAAGAGQDCDQARNEFDRFACLHQANQAAEQALGASYQELILLLDADGRARLRSHQLAWIRTRNAQCSQRKGTSVLVDPHCLTEVTEARIRFLQERIGECKGAGCRTDKL